jgi:predicted ATPase
MYSGLGEKLKRKTTGNSGFAKKRVQWLIEHSTSHQLLWYVDSFVLRNPLLRQAPKRYLQA